MSSLVRGCIDFSSKNIRAKAVDGFRVSSLAAKNGGQ
jgi:hypothetical protein